jgi:hypothetical protein
MLTANILHAKSFGNSSLVNQQLAAGGMLNANQEEFRHREYAFGNDAASWICTARRKIAKLQGFVSREGGWQSGIRGKAKR